MYRKKNYLLPMLAVFAFLVFFFSSALAQTYAIGDLGPGGGTVFYITDGGEHGLEAAPNGLEKLSGDHSMEWGCFGISIPNTRGTGIGTGARNTRKIMLAAWKIQAGCTDTGIAAKIANDYFYFYDDWYLPSKDELYDLKDVIGGFAADSYWSSSEDKDGDGGSVWYQDFTNGLQSSGLKDYFLRVRVVRAF